MKQTTKLLTIAIAVTTFAACSSKSKKKTTTPVKSSTAGPSKATTGGTVTTTGDSDGKDSRTPASLGKVIYFEFDSSALGDAARAELENNATWMKEDPKRTLLIEGHTDEQGTPEYNVALGERRARAAKDYLVRMGVDKKRIKIITYGEERPASDEDSQNRRSVFIATKKKNSKG